MKNNSRIQYALQTQLKVLPLIIIFIANSLSLELSSWHLPLYPFLGLAFYFHWMIYRPDCLPPILLALVIFVGNTWLSDSPSFILPAIYLGLYPVFLKYRHRLFGQKFSKVWTAYIMYALLTTTIYWAAKALIAKEYFSYLTLLMSTSVIGLFYPFITIINSNLQRLIPLR